MKKGLIKKAIVAASVLPCMLITTACGTVGLSATQKEDSYKALRNLVVSQNFVDVNSEAGVYTGDAKTEVKYDFSKSGLTASQVEQVKQDFYLSDYEDVDKTEVKYGFREDGTGYRVEKELDEDTNQLAVEYQEFTKKTDEDYIAYNLDRYHVGGTVRDGKIAKIVDKNYSRGNYAQDLKIDVFGEMYDIFEKIEENSTFAKFTNSVKKEFEEEVEAGDALKTKFNIKKLGKEYSLTFTAYLDDFSPEEEPGIEYDLSSTIKIVFDKDSINEILNATEMEVEGELKCSEMDLDVDGVNFTDKNVISIKQSSETTTKFDLDSSFDALVLEEPTTGYVGMGLNGEIVNRESDLCIYEPFTNKLLGFRRGAMGDSFNLDDLQWDSIPNTEIGGYYYDKEFTQPVEEDLVFPSYDRDIYAKIVPVQGLTVLAVHTEYYNEYKDDTTNYTSSNSAGTYINNIEEGYKIKEIFVNGKVYEGNWEDGFKYDANTFYYIDIILENAEQ